MVYGVQAQEQGVILHYELLLGINGRVRTESSVRKPIQVTNYFICTT